ncbi:unnamed protein product [Schistosoma turkestanicum]|nr:unnamed protein product [Schistosoma turkestanicum]
MRPIRLFPIFVVLLLFYDEILAKPKVKSLLTGIGRSKTFPGSKSKHRYSGSSGIFSRRSGLSNSQKKALFFAGGTLAGIYIGSRMRSHVRLNSYRDLYNYEVCEGQRTEFINATGMTKTYSYFLCPDNPNKPFEKYCCRDPLTLMGACCLKDEDHQYLHSGSGVRAGIIFGVMLLVIISVAIMIYCCKYRRRSASVNVPMPQFIPPLDPMYKPYQLPVIDPTSSTPAGYLVLPYPPNGQSVGYPQNFDVPFTPAQSTMPTNTTEQIGSGWGVDANLSIPAHRPDFPPPPYPGSPTSNAEEVDASAPSSAWMKKS